MATLSSDTDIVVPAVPAASETESLVLLPAASVSEGKGRLVHPVLGTYDYPNKPNRWTGLDSDIVAAPTWAHAQTLGGGADTLWQGSIRDVAPVETWDLGELGSTMAHVRTLMNFWLNPPPVSDPVLWFPSYATVRGYKVAIVDLSVGGERVTLDFISRGKYARGSVALTLRVLGRAEDA